jgi:hypothetical protein
MNWLMVIYILAVHQARVETVTFDNMELCNAAIKKVKSLSVDDYPINAVCVQVKKGG